MLINRDNYETIFLMYVDNELSSADRLIVEGFVQTNQDLLEELEVLQSTVLTDDDAVFVPKTQLYRNATPVESVQESLLLHLDNELPDEFRKGLIQQINKNTQVKEEWTLLQKTVLDKNDKILFTNKKLLYRHTDRVISIKIWRAAAAVLIGLGLFTGITLYNGNSDKVIDSASVDTKPDIKTIKEPGSLKNIQPPVEDQDLIATGDVVPQSERQVRSADVVNSNKKSLDNIGNAGFSKSNSAKDKTSVKDEVVLTKQDNLFEKSTFQSDKTKGEIVVTNSPVKEELTNTVINDVEVGKKENTYARLALKAEDPDRFLNIEEDKVTRTKLGGIIRQVKRVVERNTKIKTSNGLRIGGFEIAIK